MSQQLALLGLVLLLFGSACSLTKTEPVVIPSLPAVEEDPFHGVGNPPREPTLPLSTNTPNIPATFLVPDSESTPAPPPTATPSLERAVQNDVLLISADTAPSMAVKSSLTLGIASSRLALQEQTMLAAYGRGSDTLVAHLTTDFEVLSQFTPNGTQAIGVDPQGNLYFGYSRNHNNIPVAAWTCGVVSEDTFTLPIEHELTGEALLVNPQGLAVLDELGIILVADANPHLPAIVAYSRNTFAFRTTELGGKHPQDLSYDAQRDRLYVTTSEGIVLVFARYSATHGSGGPTQMITPFDPTGERQVSSNLHGIVYLPSQDALILSDVGRANDLPDGQLFVIQNASGEIQGNVPVRLQISGISTLLREPIDIAFDGSDLYVAEKRNGFLLRFDNLLTHFGSLRIAPDALSLAPGVQAVVVLPKMGAADSACEQLTAIPAQTSSPVSSRQTQPSSDERFISPVVSTQSFAEQIAPLQIPATLLLPTQGIPATSLPVSTQVLPTRVLPTQLPPTLISPTQLPPTQPLPTQVPPTQIPPTQVPPTQIPSTQVPPPTVPQEPSVNSGNGNGNNGNGNGNGGGNGNGNGG